MQTTSILIVEDENISAMNLQRKLQKLGYSVSGVASSAESAIQHAKEKRPHLVLMDIALKGSQDGISAASKMQEMDIPVVYLSALSDEKTLNRARETNPFGYLLKPLNEKALHSAIKIALYKHQGEQQLRAEIAQRKQVEDMLEKSVTLLRQSNEDLEHFASLASHDLREPLRTLSCCLGMIKRESENPLNLMNPKLQEYLDFALKAAPRMQSLVDDLLEYSHVGNKQKNIRLVESNALFKIAVANLNVAIREASAEITCDDLPSVFADERDLVRLFQNLLSNAIKYRADKAPKIHVGCEAEAGEWRFSVQDNGIGIAPREQEQIFIVFRRLHTRERYEGNGIGLAICKRIVEAHQGRIWVDSRNSQGSTFFFTLPLLNTHPNSHIKLVARGELNEGRRN